MTLFTTSRPTISVKSVTRYPTRITTGTGLSYTYDNGTLNISLDYSDIPDSAAIADPSNYTTVVYNKTTGLLEEVQLDYIPTTVVTDPVYTRGDSNFTIPNDYRVLSLVANLTASRTWTLPSAANVTSGDRIFIYDTVGGVSAAYPLVIAAPTGNTINGASSITLSNAFAGITIVSNSGTQWTAILTNVDSVGGLGTNVANALKSAVNSANGVIRLDSSGNVPALNGAALTSLNASNLGSGTVPAARLPGPSLSTIGGVKAKAAETSKFVNQIDTDGSVNLAQPAFSDISGSVAASQLPNPSASTLGGVQSKAAESNKFLTAIGTDGTVSNAQPSASNISGLASSATTDTTNASNITSGTLSASRLPNPSATTLGGVQSKAAISNQFLTQIGTDGVVASAQPAVSNISGLGTDVGTALGVNVGSAGSVVVNGGALGTPASGNLANCTFPTLNQNTTGTAANVTGTVAVANGGTGLTSLTANRIPYASATNTLGTSANLVFDGNNLGVGGTPSAWVSTAKTIDVGAWSNFSTTANGLGQFGWNNYESAAGVFNYKATNAASAYRQVSGVHSWLVAPSGTANAVISFTTAMTLNASGELGVAKSPNGYRVDVEAGSSGGSFRGTRGTSEFAVYQLNNSDAYIGMVSNNNLQFITNNTAKMTLNASGNLGLGVTPKSWGSTYTALEAGNLMLSSNDPTLIGNAYHNGTNWLYSTTNYATRYESNLSNGAIHAWFRAASGTANATVTWLESMRIDANGNVGIGTSSPTSRVEIVGGSLATSTSGGMCIASGLTTGRLGTYDAASTSAIHTYLDAYTVEMSAGSTSTYRVGISVTGKGATNYSNTIRFITSGTGSNEAARIDANGNLGIATTSPGTRLNIKDNSSAGIQIKTADTNFSCFNIGVNTTAGYSIINSTQSGTGTTLPIAFFVGGTERARIDGSGNLLVGTTTKGGSSDGSATNLSVVLENGGTITSQRNNDANIFLSKASGYSSGDLINFYVAGSRKGVISTNGTNTTYGTSSDISLKENISDAASALASILTMPIRQFDWKVGGHTDYGVVAQEADGYAPEIVTKGDIWSVDYGRITPRLIKAFQELAAKVQALEAKVA